MSALLHPDGLHRCPWSQKDPLYVAYHDDEWGVPEWARFAFPGEATAVQ